MSVTSARLSPAANLLRNSRLFAVPAPLPNPPPVVTSQSFSASDTATLPYPTHAAIETSQLARRKGDWGLKRLLPARLSRKDATQAIRVRRGIDTIEQIADYESAGDHSINLQKWQALHIPVLMTPPSEKFSENSKTNPYAEGGFSTSVFEDRLDNIVKREDSDARRWRFEGPWLQGLSGLEFDGYLKEVGLRKVAFREYIRATMTKNKLKRLRSQAQDQAQVMDETSTTLIITEDELQDHLKSLRNRPEEFSEMISAFLDLPEGPKTDISRMSRKDELSSDEYALSGPPKTHPSAGLSYLRSTAYAINHPEHGPQTIRPPVPTRYLKSSAVLDRDRIMYGIAGVVTNTTAHMKRLTDGYKSDNALDTSREAPAGGNKTLAQPVRVSIDAEGGIRLVIKSARAESRAIFMKPEEFAMIPKPEQPPSEQGSSNRPIEVRQGSGLPPLDENYGRDEQQAKREPFQSSASSLGGMSPDSSAAMDQLNAVMGGRRGTFG